MRQDQSQGESPIALASAPASGAARAASADAAVSLPRLRWLSRGVSLPRLRVSFGQRSGQVALRTLIVATLAVVAWAAAGPSILVPRSAQTFPSWEAGPLYDVVPQVNLNPRILGYGFSAVLVAMLFAYGVMLATVPSLSTRAIVVGVVVLHVILLLSPPLQLSDLFNYLGYARLGALHHLNPYTHVIKQEFFDPVFRFTSWHSLKSPYGPLFTAFTYPLAFVSLPVAFWTLKVLTVLLSLGFVALVWQCARQLGRDPRFAVVFVAFNPIFLIYAIAGFHNDFFMLVASMGAIALMLARRDRAAGAAVMIAVAVKFTAILVLPFLLVAARSRPRRLRIILGAAVAAVPLVALDLTLFGLSIPNLSDQSSLLTEFSIPNVFGVLIGIGGATPGLLRLASVAVVLVVAHQVYRRRDWLEGAGWATFALIASLAWLVPWYVIWLLPLAGLSTSVKLRRAAVALTLFLVLAFVPATGIYFAQHGIDLLGSSVGQASKSHQQKLAE